VSRGDVGVVLVAAPDADAKSLQAIADAAIADAEFLSQLTRRYACRVSLDDVVHVERGEWSGQIFDLQTDGRAYFAENIIVSNCVRSFTPLVGAPSAGAPA
jgi:hypothetical protein